MKKQQLLFVYNANSDLFSTVSEFAHKILSPSTYQCRLCALTYGNFSVKQDWKSFIEALPIKSIFLYKDEFVKRYKLDITLPIVFILSADDLIPIIPKQQLETCQSLEELKKLVIQKLEENVQHHHSHLQ